MNFTARVDTRPPARDASHRFGRHDFTRQFPHVHFHFLAFDVDAKVFGGIKQFGATLVGASDETQLKQKLNFILEEKILLEKE